jgi:integrase
MASLFKRASSPRWYLRYVDSTGKVTQESLYTTDYRVARQKKLEKEYELTTGRLVIGKVPTFCTYSKLYLDWHAGEYPDSHERVKQIVEDYLEPEFGHKQLDQITKLEAKAWTTNLRLMKDEDGERVLSESSISKLVRTLKAVLNDAVDNEVIERNRIGRYAVAEVDEVVPTGYSAEQLTALYDGSPNHADCWRFMVNTGVRRAEFLSLKLVNVRLQSPTPHIIVVSEPGARTKSKRFRTVPLNVPAQVAAKALIAKSAGEYLAPRIAGPSLSRAFDKCATRAKLPGSMHWLRHSFVLNLLLGGAHIRTAQVLAGHSTIKVTERYLRVLPDQIAKNAVLAIPQSPLVETAA